MAASGSSGVKNDAFAGLGQAQGQADNAYNTVNPIYTQEATHPMGLTPQQIADQRTASDQTLGGSDAAAAGEGARLAATTNNAGGYQAAIAEAARRAGQTQSQNNLGIDNESDMLARQQQQEGLAGLNGIYNTQSQDALSYLNTANAAKPTFWQNMASDYGGQLATAAGHGAGAALFGG